MDTRASESPVASQYAVDTARSHLIMTLYAEIFPYLSTEIFPLQAKICPGYSPPMKEHVVDRLKLAVAKSGKSDREVSLSAGMSADGVRGVMRNQSPTVDTIRKIAGALDVPPEWLAFGVGSEPVQSAAELESIPIRGEVAAGQWLSIEFLPSPDEFERAPLAYTPEWPRDAQYCLRVKGTSINNRAADGDILRCIDIAISGVEPMPGDLVIVQQSRFDGAEVEVTAKILRKSGATVTLEPDSTDKRHKPIVMNQDTPHDGTTARIIAIVDMVFRPMRRLK